MKSHPLNLKKEHIFGSRLVITSDISSHKRRPDHGKYTVLTSSLSSLALWKEGSRLNSPVNLTHSPTFSGETKSRATLMQDCTQMKTVSSITTMIFDVTLKRRTKKIQLGCHTGKAWPHLQISHLVRTSSRNENSFTKLLFKRPGFNT